MPSNLVSSSFSRGEVTPELGGRVDIASYKTSLATARNVIVRSYGGLYNRTGSQHLGYAAGTANTFTSRLRRFKFNTTDVYILEFYPNGMRVIRNDAYVLDTIQAVTNVAGATMTIPAHGYNEGDFLILDSSFVGASLLPGRTVIVHLPTTNTFQMIDPITGAALTNIGTPWVSGGNAGHVYSIPTPYTANDITIMSFVQSADVMTITVHDQSEQELTRTGDAAWALTTPTFAPTIEAPTSLIVTPNPTGSTTVSYVVTSIDANTGEESLPSAVATITNSNSTISNNIAWTAPGAGNVSLYSVYRAVNGIYGFIGDTPLGSFNDTNFSPDLSTTPPNAADPFANGNVPATAMYFQQRLIRSGSDLNPDTLYCSQVGLFYNMSGSTPTVDSDALIFSLTSREVNQVRHLVPIKQDLIAFTAGQEWRISSNGAAFAAENLAILPQSAWGSGYLEPILIGLTILSVRENGMTIRTYRYTYLSDAYTGEEASLLSSHLFTPSSYVTSWALAVTPDPIIVGTLANGTAFCNTYQEEQQINAYTRWDTDGVYENVEAARPDLASSSLDEEVYFVVNRVVNGHLSVRTIEKVVPRRFSDVRDCFFVDAGLTYDHPVPIGQIAFGGAGGALIITTAPHNFNTGTIVTFSDITWMPTYDVNWNLIQPQQLVGNAQFVVTVDNPFQFTILGDTTGWVPYLRSGNVRACASVISGLYHLEGQMVSVLADGNSLLGQGPVVNGQLTLPAPAGRVHIGRQFFSDVGTQSLEAPQGSIQGKEARVPFATVRVVNSRGWIQGQTNSDLLEVRTRQFEDIGDPVALFTGDVICTLGSDWDKNGTVFIRQANPLPLEIIDIIPAIDLEDG